MPKLVNENQRSFIPGRQASDNVVLAQEIRSMRKERGKKGCLAFKIDLEKADDKIEWRFLEKVLGAAGLEEPLIKLIMFFVSFTTLSVIWNGEWTDKIYPTKGLRQGDPLLPYLFVLCMKTLGHMISNLVAKRECKGIKITRSGPVLSHIFFADDLILFGETTHTQARIMEEILSLFCVMSSQKVNLNKSKLFISKNVPGNAARVISSNFGISLTSNFGQVS